MARVVVVGSINQDVVVGCPRAPLIGETVHGTSLDYFPGGKGSNQAVAAARYGAPVTFVGCVGADGAGALMLRTLDEAGIDRTGVRVAPGVPTGTALITVETAGGNSIVVVPGANEEVSPVDARILAERAFGAGDILVCQLEIPRAAVSAALTTGHRAGMTTVLNAAPGEDVRNLLAEVDVLVVNETEIQPNIGGDFADRHELQGRIAALSHSHDTAVVVTLGAEGCVAVGRGIDIDAPAPAARVLDTTGAGDTFVGVLAACLAEGGDLPTSVRHAMAAGTLSTTRRGAQTGMPTRADVATFERELDGD